MIYEICVSSQNDPETIPRIGLPTIDSTRGPLDGLGEPGDFACSNLLAWDEDDTGNLLIRMSRCNIRDLCSEIRIVEDHNDSAEFCGSRENWLVWKCGERGFLDGDCINPPILERSRQGPGEMFVE